MMIDNSCGEGENAINSAPHSAAAMRITHLKLYEEPPCAFAYIDICMGRSC